MSASPYGGNDSNPFEDPSVKRLTDSVINNQSSVEAYNPFEGAPNDVKQQTTTYGSPTAEAAQKVQPDFNSHPPATQTQSSTINSPPPYSEVTNDMASRLQKRQEELEKKAAELQAREEQLNSVSVRANNWPPLPKLCCFKPCFYQDISVEIPASFQKTVRTMYYMWIFYAFLLFLNMLGALALFIVHNEGVTFGLSLLILILFTPLSFVCWFRPLYKAFRSDSSFNFMVFFFVFFFQFIVAVFYAVGIPNYGSCGLLNGITAVSRGKDPAASSFVVGMIAIFIGVLWTIDALLSFYMLTKIHRIYRGTGASFAKAQEEFASGVVQNEQVRNAATTVVTNAAQQAVSQNLQGVRY